MNVYVPLMDVLKICLFSKAIHASSEKITGLLRKSMCDFQLEYTNYHFASSRLHKLFKEAPDNEKVETYDQLNNLLESGLKRIFGVIGGNIQEYFEQTHHSNFTPRVGIHLVTDNNEIIDVIRLQAVNTTNQLAIPKAIEDYTVFKEVIGKGRPYIQNNLPKYIRNSSNYKHKGFDINRIKAIYKQPITDNLYASRFRRNVFKSSEIDKKWLEMSTDNSRPHDSLYKSHVIIPITYRRHAQRASLFDEMVRILKLENEGRSILGFLCIDHPDTFYFHESSEKNYENIDINCMVLFADLISLVIVTKLMYTVGSSSVAEFEKNYV